MFHARSHTRAHSGTWNILNSIKHASQSADRVYLVEEDVMVYPYFFDWHESQTAPASCGRVHPGYESKEYNYFNPGSCLRRPLLDLLVPHINEEYYADTRAYAKRVFNADGGSFLDDGLIRCVMARAGMRGVFPESPVCAHQGFRYYNKLDIFTSEGTVLERMKKFDAMCHDIEHSADPRFKRYSTDFESYSPK